jgi:hypothetical protein
VQTVEEVDAAILAFSATTGVDVTDTLLVLLESVLRHMGMIIMLTLMDIV